MIQEGQVSKLKAKGRDGQPMWAYRYRLDGRGSARSEDLRVGLRRRKALREGRSSGAGRVSVERLRHSPSWSRSISRSIRPEPVTVASYGGCSGRQPKR